MGVVWPVPIQWELHTCGDRMSEAFYPRISGSPRMKSAASFLKQATGVSRAAAGRHTSPLGPTGRRARGKQATRPWTSERGRVASAGVAETPTLATTESERG